MRRLAVVDSAPGKLPCLRGIDAPSDESMTRTVQQ